MICNHMYSYIRLMFIIQFVCHENSCILYYYSKMHFVFKILIGAKPSFSGIMLVAPKIYGPDRFSYWCVIGYKETI